LSGLSCSESATPRTPQQNSYGTVRGEIGVAVCAACCQRRICMHSTLVVASPVTLLAQINQSPIFLGQLTREVWAQA
jgi:hypothetical protein